MQKKILVFPLLLAILLASGCVSFGEKNFSDLKTINEKYGLNGYISPATMPELLAYQKDLQSLKAMALAKNSRQTEALATLIDYRLATSKAQLALLNAMQEAKFIDYYDTSCTKETSLKITIDYLEEATTQSELANTMANNFIKNYSEFIQPAGIDMVKENNLLNNFKNTMQEKKKAYQQFCT